MEHFVKPLGKRSFIMKLIRPNNIPVSFNFYKKQNLVKKLDGNVTGRNLLQTVTRAERPN